MYKKLTKTLLILSCIETTAGDGEPEPAIHLDVGPGDQPAVVAGDEHHHPCDVIPHALLPHGDGLRAGIQPLLVRSLRDPRYALKEVGLLEIMKEVLNSTQNSDVF